MQWETVIGLEIHAQLATKSKLFSGASTSYGAKVNTQACAVDLGLPGILPVVNKQAIIMALKFGLAVGAKIPEYSIFARKNYFYPDLPKGYQISQFEFPIVSRGRIDIQLADGNKKTINITRAHLEEDAGKSVHDLFSDSTGIDLNRAGSPLIEIVSEPDMNSAKEAIAYLKKIHAIVKYLKICDGNMQEGSFRCDANISVKPIRQSSLGTRTEIKNLNSFKFIEQAIHYEVDRQISVIDAGGSVIQETRLYDPEKNETRTMRSKEEANDYRYFPEPDLLPVYLDRETIEAVSKSLPELPHTKLKRFMDQYGLSEYDSEFLTNTPEQADYFENTVKAADGSAKLSTNWIMGELAAFLNRNNMDITQSPVNARMLGEMIKRINDKTISNKIAKRVFEAMCNGEGNADQIIKHNKLRQITDVNIIQQLVEDVIEEFPDQVKQYQNSSAEKQNKLSGFFVGKIMQRSKGKANPRQVNQLLKEKLAQVL